MFTLLGDTAASVPRFPPAWKGLSWQWEGSPGCSLLLVQPALLSPVLAEAAGAACTPGASSKPRGTEAGNGVFFPCPELRLGRSLVLSKWLSAPPLRCPHSGVAFGDMCSGVLSCGGGA